MSDETKPEATNQEPLAPVATSEPPIPEPGEEILEPAPGVVMVVDPFPDQKPTIFRRLGDSVCGVGFQFLQSDLKVWGICWPDRAPEKHNEASLQRHRIEKLS